jgi:4-nitrophenyl phosphatase
MSGDEQAPGAANPERAVRGPAVAPTGARAPATDDAGIGRPPLADVETVFLDLDGCVWFGSQLADGAIDLVAGLRASGRRVGFLTNTSNHGTAHVTGKLQRLGVEARVEDVIMPVDSLAEHPRLRRRPSVWFFGPTEVRSHVAAVAEIADDPDEAELVVLGRDTSLTYGDLTDALSVLVRGGGLLAFNVDPRVPVEGGRMLPGTGAIAAALSYASGVQPEIVGKPSRLFFETALRRFGASAERSAIVGDTLDSDIAGGARAGLRTVLVGAGSPSRLDPPPTPDHHVATLRDVWALFER